MVENNTFQFNFLPASWAACSLTSVHVLNLCIPICELAITYSKWDLEVKFIGPIPKL